MTSKLEVDLRKDIEEILESDTPAWLQVNDLMRLLEMSLECDNEHKKLEYDLAEVEEELSDLKIENDDLRDQVAKLKAERAESKEQKYNITC